jgi:hypothetical protein
LYGIDIFVKLWIISARKMGEIWENPCRLENRVYKYQSPQTSIADFNMPLGLTLDPDNRWVKKAQAIPWLEIERRYAELFPCHKGGVAKPLRLALGALLIQMERDVSDAELVLQIQETPCLQYFCGLPGFTETRPFDPSSLVHFRKRLTREFLAEINEMVIAKAVADAEALSQEEAGKREDDEREDDVPKSGGAGSSDGETGGGEACVSSGGEVCNCGVVIYDSTCFPLDICHPRDFSLLRRSRLDLEKMVDALHSPLDGDKPRTYRKKAKRVDLEFAKSRGGFGAKLRKVIRKQLGFVRRDLDIVAGFLSDGRVLPGRLMDRYLSIRVLYTQQLEMYTTRTRSVPDRIVSLSQPWVRAIPRGKPGAKWEFGPECEFSVIDGFTRVERVSFDPYNEGVGLIELLERYKARTGFYPERVLADKIYRNRANISFCVERGIVISGPPLGRPRADVEFSEYQRRQTRRDEVARVAVEREFSYVKGSFGLARIRARLRETTEAVIGLAVIAMNVAHIVRRHFCLLFYLFENLFYLLKNLWKRMVLSPRIC